MKGRGDGNEHAMRKKRILLVMDHLDKGGAERQFMYLATGLDREKFEIVVFLTCGGGVRLRQVVDSGIKVIYRSKEICRNTLWAISNLYKCIKDFSPDLIMTWLSYSITLTAFVSTLLGHRNLIASERTELEYLFNHEVRFGRVKKLICKWAFLRSKVVVANAKAVAEELITHGYAPEHKVRVIYNGIDLKMLSGASEKLVLRKRLGLKADGLYGIYAGAITRRKGIPWLLEALRVYDGPDLRFIIVGEGELSESVRNDERVEFLGYKGNAEEYMKASDYLVLPSIYEGMPNVVMEAMALGTPVIATNVSGAKELIEHEKNGMLIAPMSAGELSEMMSRLGQDTELTSKIKENALRFISRFSIEQMLATYEELFASVIMGTKP